MFYNYVIAGVDRTVADGEIDSKIDRTVADGEVDSKIAPKSVEVLHEDHRKLNPISTFTSFFYFSCWRYTG